MEHVPMPSDPIAPLPRVPYLCKDDLVPYDGSDFFTYPARNGFPSLSEHRSYRFHLHESSQPSDDHELESFMQSWAFFGLLHHFLDQHGLYDARDYLEPDNERRPDYIHTRKLDARLKEWIGVTRGWDESRRSEEKVRLQRSVALIRWGVLGMKSEKHSGCDAVVVSAILLVAETMSRSIVLALDKDEFGRRQFVWLDPIDSEGSRRMLRNGWCPTEVAIVQGQYASNSALLYLSHLRRKHPDNLNHSSCQGRECCVHSEIDPATYRTRHTDDDCKCDSIGPDMDQVKRYLKEGTYPVIRVGGDSLETMSVDITSAAEIGADPTKAFVAISHVWADGMGNPKANTLPRCQILRMRHLLNSIKGHEFHVRDTSIVDEVVGIDKIEDRDLAIWCDTLCVPMGNTPETAVAIGKLRGVYSEAAYVLVLDRGLSSLNFRDLDPIEAAVRFTISRWMQRLWTLQEAATSQKILVRFADETVDLRDIRIRLEPELKNRPSSEYFLFVARTRLRSFNMFYDLFVPMTQVGLDGLVSALRHRRVSHAGDEALCVATIFKVEFPALVAAADPVRSDGRFVEFWRQMALPSHPLGISQLIVFADVPRLKAFPGYRWAPATFLGSLYDPLGGSVFGDPSFPCYRRSKGLTERGLRVALPGWRVRLPGPRPGIWEGFVHDFALEDHVHIRVPPSREGGEMGWMSISEWPKPEWPAEERGEGSDHGHGRPIREVLKDRSKVWYVIRDDEKWPDDARMARALLAFRDGQMNGRPVLRTVMQIGVLRADSAFVLIANAVVARAVALRQDWKTLVLRLLWLLIEVPWLGLAPRGNGLVGRTNITILSGLTWLIRALRADLKKISTEAVGESREVAAMALYANPSGKAWLKIHSIASIIFMGAVLEVAESYDADEEWVID